MAAINSDFEAPLDRQRLAKNLGNVRQRIVTACQKVGREPQEVTLVAVTKTVGAQTCNDLIDLGCLDLAENRPQVLWDKSEVVDPRVRWHFIGHLQRNKSNRTVKLLSLMQSLDSIRLGEQLVKDTNASDQLRVLLEVNITQDESKTGLSPEQAEDLLHKYKSDSVWQECLQLCGVMGMSSLQGDESQTHREFEGLRNLRDRWQSKFEIALPVLSMGMSDDFEIAIEQGSTMVRIGSLLYR